MLEGMAGLNGIGPGVGDEPFIAIAIGLAIVWGLPDTASVFMKWFDDATLKTAGLVPQKGLRFTTRPWISGTLAFLLFLSIVNAWNTAEFIYYNF